jgi:hypothetical protein
MFKFFKDFIEAFGEKYLSEAEDLESLRELGGRLAEIFELRARGEIGPSAIRLSR